MAWVVGSAQNLVSHHLRQMKKVAVITAHRDDKLVMYPLTPLSVDSTAAALASFGLRSAAVTKVKSLPLTTASGLPMPADNGCGCGCDCWSARNVPPVAQADVRGV